MMAPPRIVGSEAGSFDWRSSGLGASWISVIFFAKPTSICLTVPAFMACFTTPILAQMSLYSLGAECALPSKNARVTVSLHPHPATQITSHPPKKPAAHSPAFRRTSHSQNSHITSRPPPPPPDRPTSHPWPSLGSPPDTPSPCPHPTRSAHRRSHTRAGGRPANPKRPLPESASLPPTAPGCSWAYRIQAPA